LGRGASGWLPSVYRAPRPFGASPFPVSAPSTGGKGGVKYTCVLEVGGPELRVEEFRALLDAILRVVAVDAAVNT